MNPPALAAARFGWGLVMGAGLGILYGAMGPPRQKHPHLWDFFFMAAAFYGWLVLNFAVCRADIRPVYSLAILLGFLLEEATLGRLLRPVFSVIWKKWWSLLSFLSRPWKKFLKKIKLFFISLFATVKKWSTIYWNHCRHFQ